MIKHYVDENGVYIGGYLEGDELPVGAVEVPAAPEHGADVWTGTEWDITARPLPIKPRYFTDAAGVYLGCFQGAEPPNGAEEIPGPPEHGADKLVGGVWDKSGRPMPEKSRYDLAIEAIADSLPMANDRANIRAILAGEK